MELPGPVQACIGISLPLLFNNNNNNNNSNNNNLSSFCNWLSQLSNHALKWEQQ